MDTEAIEPGDHVSSKIEEGLTGSDYFLLVITDNSNESEWVKREIALATELSDKKNLTVVPFLAQKKTPVPFEFRGLLHIKADVLDSGLERLIDFFRAQMSRVGALDERILIQKTDDPAALKRRLCQDKLRELELADLRYELSKRLTVDDVKTLWWDVFHCKMEDEVQVPNLRMSTVELLDRARREELLPKLIDLICRNHPRFSELLSD
jgi:hypothetical protein